MADDPLAMFHALRNPPPAINGDIRQSSSDLHSLAMVPGSPEYRSRIPDPPCTRCGEDHFPGRAYDHPWTGEPAQVHDEPVAASAVMRRTAPQMTTIDVDATTLRRIALYVGRGDLYVVSVEVAPDWDSVDGGTFRVEAAQVLVLVRLARALGIKIVDKTGGDLLMLEQEDVSQHAQDHGRGAPSPGGSSPRRPGPDAAGAQEGREDRE
jgi:hypothetical protein